MDPDEDRSPSDGLKPQQNTRPASTNADATACETSSPGTRPTTSSAGIRGAGYGVSSSSSQPGVPVSPGRTLSKTEATTSRIIGRIVEVRRDLFGDDGIPAIADALHLPHRTWSNYEKGVVMPAVVLLFFLDLTSVDPHWLLTGKGRKYMCRSTGSPSNDTRPLDRSSRNDLP